MKPDGVCTSCGAAMVWVLTTKGNRMPLDPDPVDDGNVWVLMVKSGTPVVGVSLTADGVPPNVTERYVTHFVTCPHAKEHRRRPS